MPPHAYRRLHVLLLSGTDALPLAGSTLHRYPDEGLAGYNAFTQFMCGDGEVIELSACMPRAMLV